MFQYILGRRRALFLALCLPLLLIGLNVSPRGVSAASCTTTLSAGDDIQAAIDAATAGDVICLSAGTYSPAATLTVNKAITLQGPQFDVDPRPSAATTRTPGGAAEAIIDGGGTLGDVIRITSSDVALNGFEVKNGTGDLIASPTGGDIANVYLGYLIIHDAIGDEGMQIRDCQNCTIEYNYVFDTYGDGINLCCGSTGGLIQFNEAGEIDSENAAIYVYDAEYTTIQCNLIDGTSRNEGIKFGQKYGPDASKNGGSILYNVIRNTTQDGIAVYMGNTDVTGNDISHSSSENGAIYVTHGVSNIDITYNTIHDNAFSLLKWIPGGVTVGNSDGQLAATVLVNYNNFSGNTPNGVFNVAGDELNAENNWWGAADGPGPTGLGSGDGVSGPIDYTPWLTAPVEIPPGPCVAGGTIEVVKLAGDVGDEFEFDPSWSDDNFFLNSGGSLISELLPEGMYSVSEVNLSIGWSLAGATCDNQITELDVETVDPAAIAVADGDAWVCTFTNSYDPTGSITITKETDPDGGEGFTFTLEPNTYPFLSKWGSSGTGDGKFNRPMGIAVDGSGNVYVPDHMNHRIQKFDADGNYLDQWGSNGTGDGQFDYPIDVAIDKDGNVFVADYGNNRIQKFDIDGDWKATWGSFGSLSGEFYGPYGLAVDKDGYVYVADTYNNRIQKFDGNGLWQDEWGVYGAGNGEFYWPYSVEAGGDGSIYVTDTYRHRVQKFDSDGNFIIKWGSYGSANGKFSYPAGVAVDALGNVYVADTNSFVQKFDSDGNFLAKWGGFGTADGQFKYPYNVAIDGSGYIYVSDTYNHRIQKFGLPNVVLDDDESHTFAKLPAGTYTVSETDLPPNWSLDSATCDNAATQAAEAVDPASIPVAVGDAWECLFTNVYTPPNVCAVGTSSSLWTDILGKGMGNTRKHKNQVKLNIPNYAAVDSLYGQMVAKNTGHANYVRFILPGKNNWVQVNAITSPAAQQAGNFWYGDYIPAAKLPTKSVTGRWFLQPSGTKNHIPRALVLYPTYIDPVNTWVNIWNTYDAAEGEVYWDTANGWTPTRVITESIAPPNGPTTFNVELALVDNDKDARPIWVTVKAGDVTQTQMPNNPNMGDQLNLMTFTLENVPEGTDTITITIYSPSMALDEIEGDSAMLVGMRANYMCAPLD